MTPANFKYLADLLKKESGLVLTDDKRYLAETRLLPIARAQGLGDLDALAQAMRRPGANQLVSSVVEAMTTNETFFFRDKTPFDNLVDTALPALLANRKNGRLRIWCAAASSGQEPYSIAIAIREMGPKAAGSTFEIIGTDLSSEILEKAKAGRYSQFEVQRGLPVQLLLKYFKQTEDSWQINPEIRNMVQFRPLNLLRDFSALGKFDIVFCRNVLIYFDRQTKTDILERIHRQMSPDGYLALGAAETVIGITDIFGQVQGKRGLYTSSSGAQPSSQGGTAPELRLATG